ncbi:hypothetical protein FQ087_05565 [Sporosarcina sp. ANT_H38]|uniref:hypothetical protein n=1 Tax=Sporosarcina sp. ANT_H38 TaxID=2597358 RepID=UPI0011F0CC2B|nr:hypothetical protein [Sporosarcina sp. ANT_H38]KAA0965748.1 hypothetical protein FQ087_05565 [Sporosarcina sp. ANT_H38]
MELNRRKVTINWSAIAGLLSFVISLVALAGLNASLLLNSDEFPSFFIVTLPSIGFVLGVFGLFNRKSSSSSAIWGIALCVFIFLFTFLMFGLAWTINPKP